MSTTLNYRADRPSSHAPDNALTQLVRRLEAATSRLEDIASSATSFDQSLANGPPPGVGGIAASQSKTSSMPDLAAASRQQPVAPPPAPQQAALPAAVADMDTLMNGDLKKFVTAGEGLDKQISEQVLLVHLLSCHAVLLTLESPGTSGFQGFRRPASVPLRQHQGQEA